MSAECSSVSAKRKRKHFVDYSHDSSKKMKRDKIACGMKGILISCNNGNEGKAVREAYDLCNEFYKQESEERSIPETNSNDLSEQLKLELEELKSSEKVKEFHSIDSGAKNLIFIQFNIELSPRVIAERIFDSFIETKTTRTRFILKFIPISYICQADILDIKKTIPKVLKENSNLFTGKPAKYTVQYKCRNNPVICRTSVLDMINLAVSDEKVKLFPSYSDSEFGIIVEIIASKCCIGLVRFYDEYSKYNINQLNQKHSVEVETRGKDSNDIN